MVVMIGEYVLTRAVGTWQLGNQVLGSADPVCVFELFNLLLQISHLSYHDERTVRTSREKKNKDHKMKNEKVNKAKP